MMLRGRHRGLPYALDRAINLPHDLVTDDAEGDRYRDGDNVTSVGVGESERESRGRKLMKSLTQ
jgi:hypothetical protein